jgi:cyclohexanone monooxygenase
MAQRDGELQTSSAANKHRRRIGIIGAGPGGMCTAIKLKNAGYEDITIFERSAGVGGTWYNNRYPGLACDVPSHLYSFSFFLNAAWSRAYAPQPEILSYMQRMAEQFELMSHIRLSTEVMAAHWNHNDATWSVHLGTGEVETFDVLVSAVGMFNGLNWPDIPGLEEFQGLLFHAGQWREHHATANRTVAIIGSAASAVQIVPRIAPDVKALHLYQRSPNWVLPKDDPVYDEDVIEERCSRLSAAEDLWQERYKEMDDFTSWPEFTEGEAYRERCLQNLSSVEDPELRQKLTPDHPWGCTRPLFSNEYYPAFNRDNVELVTAGIARITPRGIIDLTGRERPADVIVCATGYHVDRFASIVDIRGRNGLQLAEAWKGGAIAYLGISTSGFPNLFMIYGPNTNNGSLLFMLECQAACIARRLNWMDDNGTSWMDVRPDAVKVYNETLQKDIDRVKIWQGGCRNYYRAASGLVVTQYPHNMTAYRMQTEQPDWESFEFG